MKGPAAWIAFPLLLIFCCPCLALVLAWDSTGDLITSGYKVYSGPAHNTYTASTDVGNVTETTITLPAGTYFLAVVAYSSLGFVSDFSNEIMVVIPYQPPPPVITRQIIVLHTTNFVEPWKPTGLSMTVTNPLPSEFFKVQIITLTN